MLINWFGEKKCTELGTGLELCPEWLTHLCTALQRAPCLIDSVKLHRHLRVCTESLRFWDSMEAWKNRDQVMPSGSHSPLLLNTWKGQGSITDRQCKPLALTRWAGPPIRAKTLSQLAGTPGCLLPSGLSSSCTPIPKEMQKLRSRFTGQPSAGIYVKLWLLAWRTGLPTETLRTKDARREYIQMPGWPIVAPVRPMGCLVNHFCWRALFVTICNLKGMFFCLLFFFFLSQHFISFGIGAAQAPSS